MRFLPLLSFLLPLFSFASAAQTPPKEAYVSLLYGDTYALPLRVMMQSLRINSPDSVNQRERIVLQTGRTSPSIIQRLKDDGIRVIPVPHVPSPYVGTSKFHPRFGLVMTKLKVFDMTQYTRLLFIDADSLVLQDLSPVFSCARFCAVFINPCYFNSGFMLVTPNASVYQDMRAVLYNTPSYDETDQGFLNSYYTEMLRAPLFHINQPMVNESFARFPFAFHTDHSSYYNQLAFTFEKNPLCGPARDIEWLGPPVMKPWIWWGYSIFDLNWKWYDYRRTLQNEPFHDWRQKAFTVAAVIITYAWMNTLYRKLASSQFNLFMVRVRTVFPFRRTSSRMSSFYPAIAGFLFWIVTVVTSIRIIPTTMPPQQAFFTFMHIRATLTSITLILVGLACFAQKSYVFPVSSLKDRKPTLASLGKAIIAWSTFDAMYIVVWDFVMWKINFSTIWRRSAFIIAVVASQLTLALLMIIRTVGAWLRFVPVIETAPPSSHTYEHT